MQNCKKKIIEMYRIENHNHINIKMFAQFETNTIVVMMQALRKLDL